MEDWRRGGEEEKKKGKERKGKERKGTNHELKLTTSSSVDTRAVFSTISAESSTMVGVSYIFGQKKKRKRESEKNLERRFAGLRTVPNNKRRVAASESKRRAVMLCLALHVACVSLLPENFKYLDRRKKRADGEHHC